MVVIENMPFPHSCNECRFYYQYLCHVNGVRSTEKRPRIEAPEMWRGLYCPLREPDILESVLIAGGKRMKIKVALDKGAYMPEHAHKLDAGYDLKTPEQVIIPAMSEAKIDTGVHMEIPAGYFGKLESKSGLNVNYHLDCPGGVIDSGYTGSITVIINNRGTETYGFKAGDKIVQIVIVPCLTPELQQVDLSEFERTERGSSGFGSTGR